MKFLKIRRLVSRGLEKKIVILVIALFILVFAISEFTGARQINIKNSPAASTSERGTARTDDRSFLDKLFGKSKNDSLISQDPIAENAAKDIFVNRTSLEFQKQVVGIANYISQSRQTISLTPEALRFALGEAFLGNKSLLQDARTRLENAKADMQSINPPPEAQVFHALSVELINEYGTMIKKTLETPNKDIKASIFGDLFAETRKTVTQARTEFRFLTSRFDLPYATPLVILLYDEALGR